VKNHAVSGPLGIAKKNTTPIAEVRAPQIRKRVRQGARERDVFFPIPYMRREPTTCASPFMVIQVPIRMGCSLLRYQILDMVTKAGDTAPSQNPSRKRTVAKPA